MANAFVADFDQRLSREMRENRVSRGATTQTGLGAGVDDLVAVVLRNGLAQLEVMREAACAGAVILALNGHAAKGEFAVTYKDSGARFVIIHSALISPCAPC